ncbi:MAG: futalosine hydrolase [Gemmatimonadetes bacterium]|nr:futalosine hydrolase [Gemmatimonadota bacterium]
MPIDRPSRSSDAPLALVCAVALECAELRGALADARQVAIGRKPAWEGALDGRPVILLPAGMGKTNAAQAATALLETRAVRGVLGFGVAGAYAGSGLALGDVALASAAVYGDEGVDGPDGWMSTEGIRIPLLEADGARVFNEFVLDAARVGRARAALADAGIAARVGPFVTLSACSGTAVRGEELARRWGALCEGMEGAALAHVCAIYRVPFLELRAVSNHVEDRDLSRWRLRDAAAAAQRAARVVAAAWTPDESIR